MISVVQSVIGMLPDGFSDSSEQDIRGALLSSPNLPNLRELRLDKRSDAAWTSWTIERDGVAQPLALGDRTLIDLSNPR